jgi:hypothetical protein
MNPQTPKWAPTLKVGVSMDSRIFKGRLQGSKLIGFNSSLYHWKKFLRHRCLKWALMTHFHTSNTSYSQKKSQKSNWQFNSRPLKVGNRLNFLLCRWHVTYYWKALNEDYNFSLYLISIGGLPTNLWAPKIMGVPTLRILGFSFGSPRTK